MKEQRENPSTASLLQQRFDAMIAAEDNAPDDFKTAYEAFVRRFVFQAETNEEFTAEDIQFEYRDRLDLPQPDEWRSTGSLFLRLAKEGVIVNTHRTRRSPTRGNPMTVYVRGYDKSDQS